MSQKTTMADIAKAVGVSKNAVSLALRGMPGISEEMRSRILETARKMGYSYKNTAAVSESPVKSICVIMSHIVKSSVGFFEHVLSGLEVEARNHRINCNVFWKSNMEDLSEIPSAIPEKSVGGIVCIGVFREEYLLRLKEYGIPIVLVDHYFNSSAFDCVLADNVTGGYKAAAHLFDRGCRRIGFVGDVEVSPCFFDRWLGCIKFMKEMGIEAETKYLLKDAVLLPSLSELPDAFFCCNDASAMDLLKQLGAMNVKVPEDVRLIGFDDIPVASMLHPGLSTIRINKEVMGRKAINRLLYKIANPSDDPQKILVETELIVRDST